MTSSFLRRAGLLLAVAAPLLASAPARANGRFPASNAILFSETDPDLVLLRVTFGLLVSHDRGKTFAWTCERSIGFGGNEDPMYAVTPSNAIVASTYQGISITRDQACNWSTVIDPPSGLAKQVFVDLAANPSDAKDLVVFSSTFDRQSDAGEPLFLTQLWETKDEGASWTKLPGTLDPRMLGYTVDLARSDATRLYASATRDPGTTGAGGYLLTSRNRGQSFEELAIPFVNGENGVYIAAVDPNDAERVYLRTSNDAGQPTRLLLREAPADGGPATVRTIYTAIADLPGFALSATGDKVYVGGPKDGLLVASTSDFAFQKRSSIEVQCLTLAADGVWACSSESSGFIAGRSTDDGATFTPLVRFCDITGPLACAATSGAATSCDTTWPATKASLGCDATDAGTTADAGTTTSAPNGGGSGCGSRATSATPWGALAALGAGLLAVARRRKR